ncbi:hypothetical protein SAMN06265222_101664 [Neorhodopirellula lusitana]|uniref:Uncharacterized protein n=1 Tax=Neorhodopirellula lusitana TaxID=445327 RepID=A0ABY1PRA7_9BACT|nr:hypothetical protein SAMN06265222_101664 [Neorhodopirellula lusitana]
MLRREEPSFEIEALSCLRGQIACSLPWHGSGLLQSCGGQASSPNASLRIARPNEKPRQAPSGGCFSAVLPPLAKCTAEIKKENLKNCLLTPCLSG